VVAGNAAGPTEIIEAGRSGMLTRSRDAGALTAALEQLLTDRPLRQRMAQAGRQRFLDGFTADRMTRQFEDQLEALAG
jgi:glycosyltransferase involved in cell wall biosynthesis